MKKEVIYLTVFLALIAGLVFVLRTPASFSVKNGDTSDKASAEDEKKDADSVNNDLNNTSPACLPGKRLFAVMLGGDTEARPLAGISEAKIMIEMPVVTGSINRFMAMFDCMNYQEIGPIRSARHDFIELAEGFDAIFAHWGGSHFALDKLKTKVIDNLDALPNPSNAFYRKSGLYAPHNGFTSLARLENASMKLNYRLENEISGFVTSNAGESSMVASTLNVGYPSAFAVRYEYDPKTNSYLRWRAGTKEIDRNTSKQVAVKNVVVMVAKSQQIEGQYNDVDIIGSGEASVFQNGVEIKGSWKNSSEKGKLIFINKNGEEIKMISGSVWISVIEPSETYNYITK